MKQYICPMHPQVKSSHEGLCPECGMKLLSMKVKKEAEPLANNEHTKKNGAKNNQHHHINIFARKFYISLLFTIPVILLSELPQRLFGRKIFYFPGSEYLELLLGSIIFFYGGSIFLLGAWRELRAKLPGMMTLIAIAITAAYGFSTFAVLTGKGHTLFWELTSLITIMLLGHWLEMRAVQNAQGALQELSKLLPDTVEIIDKEKIQKIALKDLIVGTIILVRPGGKIPADGLVIEGKSDINESMITGESKPLSKIPGDKVIAGTINEDGMLKIKVEKTGEQTFLAGVKRLIMEAQTSKSKLQVLSDRAALFLTIIALSIGIITFAGWLWTNADIIFATERFVAVLVITCPHALGLAVPLVTSISTTMAANNGLLIKQKLALEKGRNIDIILFDKTGTLTKGQYGIDKIWTIKANDENQVLQLAASVDVHSEHFIAKAIVEETQKRNIPLKEAINFGRIPGQGVKATLNGREITIGGASLLEEREIAIPKEVETAIENEAKKGKTVVYVVENQEIIGAIALSDLIREESYQAIKDLKKIGLKIGMITGDTQEVAQWVTDQLGIDEFFAKVFPDKKAAKVRFLQEQGLQVAMVGDGINDAPALTQADLGIAIGAGTNIAIESAGIILVKNDPRDIIKIFKLSKLTYAKMVQNLFWATGYNIIALPLAAGAFIPYGILMEPALAAVFMSLSTVIVALNAILLKRNNL